MDFIPRERCNNAVRVSNASLKIGYDVNNMEKLVDFDYSFQLALIGDSGVGKTCVVTRYADNQFEPPYQMTIGELCGAWRF